MLHNYVPNISNMTPDKTSYSILYTKYKTMYHMVQTPIPLNINTNESENVTVMVGKMS